MSNSDGVIITLTHLPKCPKCKKGEMLPLIDYPRNGKDKDDAFYAKGWACSDCGNSLAFRGGEICHTKVHE